MHTTNPNERAEERAMPNAPTSERRTSEGASAVDRQPVQARPEDRAERQVLFEGGEGERFRGRWGDIQASFVDEPRKAVEGADELVAEVMQRLAQQFATERQQLEQQWDRGGETDTEALRQALRRYRSFFDRLLAF